MFYLSCTFLSFPLGPYTASRGVHPAALLKTLRLTLYAWHTFSCGVFKLVFDFYQFFDLSREYIDFHCNTNIEIILSFSNIITYNCLQVDCPCCYYFDPSDILITTYNATQIKKLTEIESLVVVVLLDSSGQS